VHPILALAALPLCLQVCATDLYARRVSNRALIAALLAAAGILLLDGADGLQWRQAGLGLACGLLLLPCYAIGWMGAGDVKFFAVLGALLGPAALLPVWIGASLLAGLHALYVISAARLAMHLPLTLRLAAHSVQAHPASRAWQTRLHHARQGRRGIPYAAYLGIFAILVVLEGGGAR